MKGILLIVSMAVGVLAFLFMACEFRTETVVEKTFFSGNVNVEHTHMDLKPNANFPLAIIVAVATMLLWPVIGAGMEAFSGALQSWAYDGDKRHEPDKDIAPLLAAFWPMRLMYAIIVYPTIGIIERIF